MRKAFKGICVVFLLLQLLIYGEMGTERYNNEKNLHVVRKISKLEGVCEVAVLNRGKGVLVGIRLDEETKYDMIYNETMRIISDEFPKSKKVMLEIETDKALDIIELSYYIGTDIKNRVLTQRFNQLLDVKKP